jgi:hypothetical protein
MSAMISPPVSPAPARPWRSASDMFPRNTRRASIIGGALVLASIIVATLLAAHLGTSTIGYPSPVISITLANPDGLAHMAEPTHLNAATTYGRGLTYTWNFGDGATATGAQVSHTYATYGYYTVTLNAVDPFKQTSTSQLLLTVAPTAPKAAIAVTHDRAYNYIVTLDASASKGTDLHYYWDFGDGQSDVSALRRTITHQYLHPGTYGATLTVIDVAGQRNTILVPVTVAAVKYY